MRALPFLLLVAACGGTIQTTTDAGTDAGTSSDAGTSPDATLLGDASTDPLATFCQGDKPKMEENGTSNPVLSVKGKAIIMNCCNAAAVTIATGQHAALYNMLWRQYGAGPSPVVLGGKETTVELALGCDPSTTTCTSGNSVERYTEGFTGTITYTYAPPGMKVSYCVEVKETPSAPHGIVHSLRMWLPNVDSP